MLFVSDINPETLASALKSSRQNFAKFANDPTESSLWKILGYPSLPDPPIMMALMIKLISRFVLSPTDHDLILLAYGFLGGGYEKKGKLGERRKAFWENSCDLRGNDEPFSERNIRNKEDAIIDNLSQAIANIEDLPDYIKKLSGYVEVVTISDSGKKTYLAKLPKPKYLPVIKEPNDEFSESVFEKRIDDVLEATGDVKQTVIQTADRIIQKIDAQKETRTLALFYSCPPPLPEFIGREDELKRIDSSLKNAGMVLISGIGGIGKTELAKQFVQMHKNDYDTVSYLSYDDSIINTVGKYLLIDGFEPNEEGISYDYQEKLNFLRSCGERTLLIIDNYKSHQSNDVNAKTEKHDPQYEELCSGRFHTIIISNNFFDGCLLIDALPEHRQMEIFLLHCKRNLLDDEVTDITIVVHLDKSLLLY